MTAVQIKAIVGLIVSVLGAAAVFFPEYALPLTGVASFLSGKEFFQATIPAK